jgi:hypothetical protein
VHSARETPIECGQLAGDVDGGAPPQLGAVRVVQHGAGVVVAAVAKRRSDHVVVPSVPGKTHEGVAVGTTSPTISGMAGAR